MFLICVKVHLNTERIPPIDEPRGRLWRFSSTDYTKRGNFVVLLRLSGTPGDAPSPGTLAVARANLTG